MDHEVLLIRRVRHYLGVTISHRKDELIPAPADTSHVPCKFFRTGQCQAGKACPFSHSTDVSTVDTPCKYFAKVREPQLRVLRTMD